MITKDLEAGTLMEPDLFQRKTDFNRLRLLIGNVPTIIEPPWDEIATDRCVFHVLLDERGLHIAFTLLLHEDDRVDRGAFLHAWNSAATPENKKQADRLVETVLQGQVLINNEAHPFSNLSPDEDSLAYYVPDPSRRGRKFTLGFTAPEEVLVQGHRFLGRAFKHDEHKRYVVQGRSLTAHPDDPGNDNARIPCHVLLLRYPLWREDQNDPQARACREPGVAVLLNRFFAWRLVYQLQELRARFTPALEAERNKLAEERSQHMERMARFPRQACGYPTFSQPNPQPPPE